MIWNSVFLMTVIDMFIVGATGYALIVISRQLKTVTADGTRESRILAAVGLGLFSLFYLADLGSMHVLPWFMPVREATDIMAILHLDYQWLVTLIIVACISTSFVIFTRNMARLTESMSATETRLSAEITDHILSGKALKESGEAFKKSEERFREFSELGSDWLWEMDENLRFNYVSPNIVQLGVEPEDFIGKTLEDMHHDHYDSDDLDAEIQALSARKPYLVERPAASIPEKWLRISGKPLFSEDGTFLGYRGATTDITDRKSAEEQSKSNRRYLLESTRAIPWEADVETFMFTYVGPQGEELLGYPCEQWLEEDFWLDHLHPSDRAWVPDFCLNSLKNLEHYQFEYRMIGSGGQTVWLQDIVNVVRKNGEPAALQGFLIEITERKRAEEALQNLSARIINAHEDEGRRIARELHDDLGQDLAILSVDLEVFKNQMSNPEAPILDFLETQIKHSKELSSKLQLLSRQLHPSIIEHVGLVSAISSFCKELSDRHAIEIELTHDGVLQLLPSDVSLCLYRVVQESLRNVIKHSGARTARVELHQTASELTLRISDTGAGFDPTSDHARRGLGLLSMRERLRIVGGSFSITRMEPNGARIDVRVRLQVQEPPSSHEGADKASRWREI